LLKIFLIHINLTLFKYIYNNYIYIFKKNFIYIYNNRENNGAENLGLDFTLNIEDCFGNRKTIELKPNGATIDVTDSNKFEYIK